ncbi:MAG: hypothetical protein PHP03_01600 [Candidatus Pacebacteria bacterium]|nr:hypothetical protein [Candidatus Paceibacterota bacterium]
MKKIIIILIAVVIVGAGVGGYFYWKKMQTSSAINSANQAGDAATQALEDITGAVLPDINTNPLENKPNINPVDQTNPFKDIQTNPFE